MKNRKHNIAVLLSSYNREKYIRCQIDSILKQKLNEYSNFHLFIRDDGSEDGTKDILQEYQERNSCITVVHGKNIGFVRSFFTILEYAEKENRFDIFAFADQDDRWYEDKLQSGIDVLDRQDSPFLYQSAVRPTNDDMSVTYPVQQLKRKLTFYNVSIQTFGVGHTYMFNRALVDLIDEPLDKSRIFAHDIYFNNLAINRGALYFDPVPHNDYRQHSSNTFGSCCGRSLFYRILHSVKRLRNCGYRNYAMQMNYHRELFQIDMDEDERMEIERFFTMQKNVFQRIRYILHSKFYRQSVMETLGFKLIYIFGCFNSK